jgi:SAM-dependent methyltransferase
MMPCAPLAATVACDDGTMAAELRYRDDLFKSTAEYYDRFRPPYPPVLLDHLKTHVPLIGTSRVLDLACGTGQIAFALAKDVGELWAVDQEVEAIEVGRRKAARLGIETIRWIASTAERAELKGAFDLVAIGNAFHRLHRDAVVRRLVPHLRDGGCVALLWGGTPWRGNQPWQRALDETLERWMDGVNARDRVPQGWEEAMDRDPHTDVLRRAGLAYEGKVEFPAVIAWTVNSLIGFVYSTSFLNRGVLYGRIDAFEQDLRARLLECAPDGVFEQDATFAYELARRPV